MSNSELFYLQRIAEATERIGTQLQRLADQMCDDVEMVVGGNSEFAPPAAELLSRYETPPTPMPAGVQGLIDMPDDIPVAAAAEPATLVTKEMVVAALNMCARKHGIDAGKRVLNLFAPRLDEVPAEKYAQLVATLEALG